jgi:NADP-dependent 3-hydroxy acid dehydrogenase YdfG
MHKRIALVTGANQGVGRQVAKELVANGLTVLAGSRNFERGEAAATEMGPGAIPLQLDVTDRVSICSSITRPFPIHERATCPCRSTRR